jgi:hypothetical protein
MTFRKLAKQLETNGLEFVKSGDLKRGYAALQVAAWINRQDPEVLKLNFNTVEEN